MDRYFEIQLDNGATYVAVSDDALSMKNGDFCVIRKDFYLDYGQVTKEVPKPEEPANKDQPDIKKTDIPRIQRKATMVDQSSNNENTMRAKSALRITQQYVTRLELPMKLINAHYALDGKYLMVQFSADGRVDFRELVKLLSQELNTRIELRQIGVRDETAVIGGISVCGRPLCCCVFLQDFASINVKMAKEQDLSLTPSTISGICGRLKCCLKYEHEGYLELEAGMPRRGDCCECKEGRGRIIDRNLLTKKVVVQLDDTGRTVTCDKEEVSVIYPDKYKVQKKEQSGGGNNNGNGGQPQRQQQKNQDGADRKKNHNGSKGRDQDQ